MDEKEFMQQLRALVKEEVAAAMKEYTKPVEPVEEFISSKELCSALKISKQTLYNWLKHANTKLLIEAPRLGSWHTKQFYTIKPREYYSPSNTIYKLVKKPKSSIPLS